nr:uncharacterized protein LOC129271500 [Lytechinus pictus]
MSSRHIQGHGLSTMKAFLVTCVFVICTISTAWGCVSGAGPSWEIGGQKPGGGRSKPGHVGTGEPEDSNTPGIPIAVARYFSGNITKEEAFGSIEDPLDQDDLVSVDEWVGAGGSQMEFHYMLIRLDSNGDNHISLDELDVHNLPSRTNSDPVDETAPRLLEYRGVPDEETSTPATTTPRPRRRRPGRTRPGRRNSGRRNRPRS